MIALKGNYLMKHGGGYQEVLTKVTAFANTLKSCNLSNNQNYQNKDLSDKIVTWRAVLQSFNMLIMTSITRNFHIPKL